MSPSPVSTLLGTPQSSTPSNGLPIGVGPVLTGIGNAVGSTASAIGFGLSGLVSSRIIAIILGLIAIAGAIFLLADGQKVVIESGKAAVKGAIS